MIARPQAVALAEIQNLDQKCHAEESDATSSATMSQPSNLLSMQ